MSTPSLLRLLQRYCVTIGLIALGAGLRVWPLHALGLRAPWLTFYPVITIAALYGGFGAGLFGTGLSCLTVIFLWPWLVDQPFIQDQADWLGAAVFFINCLIISGAGEAMRRAQAQARQAQAQAEAANRAKSTFLANMSHELRTPLNAVLGFSRLLRHTAGTTPEQAGRLDIITRSAEHLLDLINNILDIAKIESGRVSLEVTATDLPQLAQEVYTLLDVRALEKQLTLRLELAPDLPRLILTDAGKLRQVLLNLIDNAIKYTAQGGVRVRVSRAPAAAGPDQRVRVEVADTGPGIRAADRERIFLPFVQLEGRPAAEAGTGLGLAICRQNVELLGGRLEVETAPGAGARFYFEIPAIEPAGEAAPAGAPPSRVQRLAAGQPRLRLLIAEDQPDNRLLLRQWLEPLGFELRDAVNGQEAVQVCRHWRPDLVWMDIRMPVMSGLEAARVIKADPQSGPPKIIALTAHALEEERLEILAAGCDDFIRKPYRERDLCEALAKHLGVRFVYAAAAPAAAAPRPLEAGELTSLPPVLLRELAQAVELLDARRCQAVIDRIRPVDHALGEHLRGLLQDLQYEPVLAVLDDVLAKEAV